MAEPGDASPPGSIPPPPAPLRPLPRPPKLPRQHLCASAQLEEKGRALVFDVSHFREPARAFVLRFEDRVVAYLNRCVHVPTELDWQPGVFLDSGREFILCSIHGAAYDPRNGRCAGGPCGQGRLLRIDVVEEAGQVYWEPTADTRPLPPGQPSPFGP